jgi:hypothetical protein
VHVARTQPRPIGAARLVPLPSEMPSAWQTAWPWLFWACWGAWLAVSDLRSEGVQPAVLRLVVGAAVLGFARPRTWWAWSLALALWIPAEPYVALLLGTGRVPHDDLGVWFLPAIPALVGGFLGRSVSHGVKPAPAH